MSERKIAVLSDIHANRWALEAVLEDVRRKGIGEIVNLGDSLYGPLDPPGTARILMKENALSILGNQDREILDQFCRVEGNPTLAFVRNSLDFSQILWLKALEPTLSLHKRMFLCHGTPNNDHAYLLEDVTPEGIADRSPVMVERELDSIREPIVVCGHSHRYGILHLADGHLVVNAGSVGLPAYRDEEPFPHTVESGSPQAVYALLSEQDGRVIAEKIEVDYDWDAAAACALTHGREDWARWIKTGKA